MVGRKRDGLLIAGGGLSGCLAAIAIATKRPDVPVLLVEEGERFGGQQSWSFFDTDIEDEDRWLVDPLIVNRWPGYYVAFPGHSRKFRTGYSSLRSEELDAHVRAVLRPEQYRLGTRIAAVREREIVLTDGETIKADGAIDARGAANLSMLELGWRKFVGRDYVFERPHGLDLPVAIDATVGQGDGYRFVSCLPLDEHRILVGDHSYATAPDLGVEAVGARLDAYVAKRRWAPGEVVREESGVLPVPIGGDFDAFLRIGGARVAKLGLRGGLFHPTTGHALPDAVRTAAILAQQPKFDGAALHDLFAAHSAKLWKQRSFYRSFNPSLLRAGGGKAMDQLHRLQGSLIERFFAGRSTALDRMRIARGG